MKKYFVAIVFVLFALTSCATLNKESLVMHGLVVNNSNIPISDVEIYKNDELIGQTNRNGFFEIEVPAKGAVTFSAKKSGWETSEFSESNVDITKLYVYQLQSLEKMYAEIEKYLLAGDFYAASPLINELENKYGDKNNALFLKSVIAYKRGEYDLADKYFMESKIMEAGNPYIKKFHEKIGGALWNSKN